MFESPRSLGAATGEGAGKFESPRSLGAATGEGAGMFESARGSLESTDGCIGRGSLAWFCGVSGLLRGGASM